VIDDARSAAGATSEVCAV